MKVKLKIEEKNLRLLYLHQIIDPEIRKKAIDNYYQEVSRNSNFEDIGGLNPSIKNTSDAILTSFQWPSGDEGHKFWNDVYVKES